jgi:hypothetical protein
MRGDLFQVLHRPAVRVLSIWSRRDPRVREILIALTVHWLELDMARDKRLERVREEIGGLDEHEGES